MQQDKQMPQDKPDSKNEFKQTVFALVCILIIVSIMAVNLLIKSSDSKNKDNEYIASLPKTYIWNGSTIRFIPFQEATIGCNNPEYRWNDRINNEGFRGEDIPVNETIIGIFGDSLTYGFCLKNNETLNHFMNLELSGRNIHIKTFNFGFPGYGLKSTLEITDYITRKYDVKYSIIYFTPDDDLIECDLSCRAILKKKNETASETIEKDLIKYMSEEVKKFPERIITLEPLLKEKIIGSGINRRSKVIFYIDSKKETVIEIFDRENISHIEPYDISQNIAPYDTSKNIETIPNDGHPAAGFNRILAKEIIDEIERLENIERLEKIESIEKTDYSKSSDLE